MSTSKPQPRILVPENRRERLGSWKEIAAYLNRDERTVRRWEAEGLPVHRKLHKKQASVYAYKGEIDAWWNDDRQHLDQTAVETNRATAVRPVWFRVGVGVLAAAAVALIVAFIYPRSRPRTAPVTLSPIPFTTYEGTETMPSFSPDGSRIAFAWDGDPPPGSKGFDLYVKVIGSENLLRLTRHPSPDWIASAWSPDGTQIAFHRISGSDSGVYVVPALGGPERKLRSTRELHRTGALIDWSRNGKWIAFQDRFPPRQSPETLSALTRDSR